MAEQYGYTVNRIGDDKSICLNGKKLSSTMDGTNRLGTYIIDDTLYQDGIPLVQHVSDGADDEETANYGFNGSNCTYGSTEMETLHRKCINITIEDYNSLLRGELVPNYKPYDRDEVYNLVDDVTTAPVITYTDEPEGYRFGDVLWEEKINVIYNNVVGVKVPTPYDFNFDNNMWNTDRPHIDVRYFDPVIVTNPNNTEGTTVRLNLRVSDYYNTLLNYDSIGPRYANRNFDLNVTGEEYIEDGIYKLVIKTEDGDTVEKYVYSGVIMIDTPPLKSKNGSDRETWFSIQCIDSRGVASIEQFLDVYIKIDTAENILDISDNDSVLGEYGIVTDIDNTLIGYQNKLGLSNLFADTKRNGYTGIKLPKRDYYLDYHIKIGEHVETPDTPTPDTPGEHTFRFLHFSDPHTCVDSVNKCKELMEHDPSINVTILTGDYANLGQVININTNMDNALHNFNNSLLVLNGNHEGWDTRVNTTQSYLKDIITEDNVVWGDDTADNANNKGRYYYIDYPINSNKLRILCVDQYQLVGSSYPLNWKPAYSQAEIDWLVSKISELNANDYLLIALHEPPIVKSENIAPRRQNDWCSANLKTWSGFVDSGNVIPMIMQAYMDKQALSQRVLNYIDPEGINTDTIGIDIDVDFTNSTPCTFIGYICGHIHGDMHTYHPDYPEQLIMCIDWANDASNNKPYWSDIFATTAPRRKDGVTINDVTLDFDNRLITIKRIGNGSGKDGYGSAEQMKVDNVDYPEVVRDEITFPFNRKIGTIGKTSSNVVIDLGSQKYWYAELSDGVIKADTVEEVTLEDIMLDVKEIFRYDDGSICYIGDSTWYNLISLKERETRKDERTYLKTYDLDNDISYYVTNHINLVSAETVPEVVKNRKLYFVYNTAKPVELSWNTTREEYIKDNLVFPDHFTVDMNGSRFIAAYTYDVHRGNLVRFWNNFDTHVKNGAFVGLYSRFKGSSILDDGFLKAHLAISHNTIGEGMGVFSMRESRYCSIDNIEISDGLGYECCVGSSGIGTPGANKPKFFEETYDKATKQWITTVDNNHKYINDFGVVVTDSNIDMVTSQLISISDTSGTKPVTFGRDGNNGYVLCGLKPEVFAFFYAADKTTYLGMITTKLYASVRPPANSRFVRYVGYGAAVSKRLSTKASNWVEAHDRGIIGMKQPKLSIGCVFKNCYIHDTRTTAITNPQGRQILFDNIVYERCATNKYLGVSSGGLITPLLGDFEDSWQWCKYVTVRNCKAIKNTDPDITASRTLIVMNCEYFNFMNNEGFSLTQGGGVESGLIANNIFSGWTINRTRGCFHPQVEMRDNVTKRLNVSSKNYDSVKQSEVATVTTTEDGTSIVDDEETGTTTSTEQGIVNYESLDIDTDYNDRIEPMIAFANSTFKTHIQYDYYKLRKCKSDTLGVDYVN